jgi:hypothetical protein
MSLEALRQRYPDRVGFRHFLVTEVTRMQGDIVCVAAIDLQTLTIVRPLQWNHWNWPASLHRQGLRPGRVVRQRIRAEQQPSGAPHEREDLQLADMLEITQHQLTEAELYEALALRVDPDIASIFAGRLVGGKYVPEGAHCRSLGSVRVTGARLDTTHDRPRLKFSSGEEFYDLPVTDLRLRLAVESGHSAAWVAEFERRRAARQPAVVRVGLARPWAGSSGEFDPKRCYVQVNGVIFQDEPRV